MLSTQRQVQAVRTAAAAVLVTISAIVFIYKT